jgi:signal transduction histidine kinase
VRFRHKEFLIKMIWPDRDLAAPPPPKTHSVEFFDRAFYPADEIAARLTDGLARGWGTAVVAPAAHLAAIRNALGEVADDRLVMVDADALYRSLAAEPTARDRILGSQLATPLRELIDRCGHVRAHGELVDVFCREGDTRGAIALERWWNRQIEDLPIELHCGYSLDSFADLASLEAFRQVCAEHGCATANRAPEHQLRTHLILLQRVTSALSEAASHDDIGGVVTGDLVFAIGATRCALAIGGQLVAVRGVTTPDEPELLAAALDKLEASWTDRPPPAVAWLGSRATAVIPLELGGVRRGTLVLGFRNTEPLAPTERMLVHDISRQLAIAIDRAHALERARCEAARAEAANAARDQFLSMLGHELRNPLSPILTATQLMRLRAPEVFGRERTTIERSVTQLMRLVDDLLDVTKLARGKIALVRTPALLAEVVAEALALASLALEDRNHEIRVTVPDSIWVDVDRARIAQVFARLVANAAKYTRSGGAIEIAAHVVGDYVEVAITDNGRGIAASLLPHIFELFVQAPQGTDRASGGLGVGLPLARSVVEMHGGTIAAHSAGAGTGSRFTVTLARWAPQSKDKAEKDTKRMSAVGDGRRVLVVDDNEDAAWLLAEALRLAGHEVAVCHDGNEALELARDYGPEIAFLDIGLPGLDGYTLCSRLREMPAKPKVVAVTGYGQAADRDRARAAGFDMHFVKPVSLREVHQAIASFSRP